MVQGPRLAAEGGVRRGCEGHQKWAPPNIKVHVGRWGAGPGSAELAEVTLSTRQLLVGGEHTRLSQRDSFCFVHDTAVWRGGRTLRLSQTEAFACVNSK